MPVHSGRNLLASSIVAAVRAAAVLFMALTNINMSSTMEVADVTFVSSVVMLVLPDEKFETRYDVEGGETKKPLVLLKSKKQWSDQWQELAKRMRRRKEQ